jgi:hypothetical protein
VAGRKARTVWVLKKGAEKMSALKPEFNNKSLDNPDLSLFWLFWAVSIDNDRQHRIKKRKRKARIAQKKQIEHEIKKNQPVFRP